jgi:uncharacterized membrane protein YfcA
MESGGRSWRLAFAYAVPIGALGGLIGLGGAEFRLPILAGPLGYSAKEAVPLNLAISIVTLVVSLATRGRVLSLTPVLPLAGTIVALTAGAVVAAFVGATWAARLSRRRLERAILMLLVGIGILLIIEGLVREPRVALLPHDGFLRAAAGVLFGLGIGLVSSLLGVAGGEIIIPTLVFAYGADIKVAGTASLLISIPTVLVGIARYANRGAYSDRGALRDTVLPMGVGSTLGAVGGGIMVGFVPTNALKVVLGVILNVSAFRIFHHSRGSQKKELRPAT